MMPAVRQ
jgi:hypothetical protein